MRQLNVGHDLDGVHYLFDRAWWQGMNDLADLAWESPAYLEATHWNFFEGYGYDAARFVESVDKLADAGLLWRRAPMPGAIESWQQIEADGHRIHVITDRQFGTDPAASHDATRSWLRWNGLGYQSLTFTSDKTSVPVDVMIEDKLENYDALEAAGTLVYLINRPWNHIEGGDDRRRIDTLDEWVGVVRALAAEKAA